MVSRTYPSGRVLQRIIVVEAAEQAKDFDQLNAFWVFGPDTTYPWPSGDFCNYMGTIYESAWTLPDLLKQHGVCIYDPDMVMDTGL